MTGEGQRSVEQLDEEETLARFRATIKERRKALGRSQGQVGYKAGIAAAEVSRLERGKREPRLWMIVRLARGLDVEPGDLLKDLR